MSRFDVMTTPGTDRILVACPDARPPAYQAVIGLARANLLHSFHTAYYYRGGGSLGPLASRIAPERFARLQRTLSRRHDPEIPGTRVRTSWGYDAALRLEDHLACRGYRGRSDVARWRTVQFDRKLARMLNRHRPDAALIFSDVGSQFTLPLCRELGVGSILSMVHGDVREEQQVLAREAESAPDFFRIYLGDGALDLTALAWLHERRLRDLELADRILVPSDHIAETLARYGTAREKISVVPYAADTRRFRPDPAKRHDEACTFLFAGGITQRKGIKYLLEAWRKIRRPGWRLQLLGEIPRDPGPLVDYLDGVEVLGRVSHADVPAKMAAADVFVFPSLFEGSAVVTYEAIACGLPCVVTPDAGSVVRDGIEGLLIPPGNVERLAEAMERLGEDPARRAAMSAAARTRAESFDWPRYHRAVAEAAQLSVGCPR